MCIGACLESTARHWAQLGLGPVLTILLLNLPPLLLWPGAHLVHGSFGGGVYTYAHDMRMHAITICNNNL